MLYLGAETRDAVRPCLLLIRLKLKGDYLAHAAKQYFLGVKQHFNHHKLPFMGYNLGHVLE